MVRHESDGNLYDQAVDFLPIIKRNARSIALKYNLLDFEFLVSEDDLYQEGCVKLLSILDKFDSDISDLQTYAQKGVYGAMINLVRKFLWRRWFLYESDVEIEDDAIPLWSSIIENQANAEIRIDIEKLCHSCSEREKNVLKMIYADDMKTDEVSIVLGISKRRVNQIRTMAINHAIECVQDDGQEKSEPCGIHPGAETQRVCAAVHP